MESRHSCLRSPLFLRFAPPQTRVCALHSSLSYAEAIECAAERRVYRSHLAIFKVQPKDTPIILGFLKERFLSVATVIVIGFLLLVALIVDTGISAAGDYMEHRLAGGEGLWHVVELAVSTVMIATLFALIFRYMPDVRIRWRGVWFGAIVTAVLFSIGKFALGLYLGKKATESTHTAAGALIVLLLWVYYSAQILFLGAELTQAYSRQVGSLKGEEGKRG